MKCLVPLFMVYFMRKICQKSGFLSSSFSLRFCLCLGKYGKKWIPIFWYILRSVSKDNLLVKEHNFIVSFTIVFPSSFETSPWCLRFYQIYVKSFKILRKRCMLLFITWCKGLNIVNVSDCIGDNFPCFIVV